MDYCAIHKQWYRDYCVYCGLPATAWSNSAIINCVHELNAAGVCQKCGASLQHQSEEDSSFFSKK